MSKIELITQQIRERIHAGEWDEANVLPSQAILSGEYGVAPGTVSLVIRNLRDEGLVRVLPRKGVILAKGRTSRENRPASATIGLRGDYIRNGIPTGRGYVGGLINAILEKAEDAGCPVLVLPKKADNKPFTREDCEQHGIGGMLFVGGGGYTEALALRREGFPVLSVNRPPEPTPVNYIDRDHPGELRDIVRRFAQLGHRRIAVLYADTSMHGFFNGLRPVFLDALQDEGLSYDVAPYWKEIPRKAEGEIFSGARTVLDEMLALPEPPTAIFCWLVGIAETTLDYLEERGIDCPREISLATSVLEIAESLNVSGYNRNLDAYAQMLVTEMLLAVEDPFHFVQKMLPVTFEDRGSLTAPPGG
ncbi:MAG TPA: substrate-binding domain-containing protein [Chthoniobacteraceae bacterium]|nr:substrate-binding domain-containing protein [Chthoniobacteraceae bacterium]